MLPAMSAVMLTACAGSPNSRAQAAPDPVIEIRTQAVPVCPPELLAARPARPAVPAGAVLTGNPAGLDWLAQLVAHTGLVEDRLSDAAAQCPAGGGAK